MKPTEGDNPGAADRRGSGSNGINVVLVFLPENRPGQTSEHQAPIDPFPSPGPLVGDRIWLRGEGGLYGTLRDVA